MQAVEIPSSTGSVTFLWLELTNRCNLQCVHCYAESGPEAGEGDLLSSADYLGILSTLREAGCERVQFIGGEPTLNKDLPRFIAHARSIGYQYIEVFTNLLHLPQALLDCFTEYRVNVATSIYSHRPIIHDRI